MQAAFVVLMLAPLVFVVGQKNTGGTASFHSKELGVAFKYSSRWKVDESVDGVLVTVPENGFPRTNFVDANASVGMEKVSRKACHDVAADLHNAGNTKPRRVRVGANTYDMSSTREGAAGNVYEETAYRTFKGGTCYSIYLTVHGRSYEPRVRQVDTRTIFDSFLRSLRFGK